jgi:hypothetical protein
MNPVFTLPYPEFAVAQEMQKLVRSCSVFVPASRQQKAIDLLLLNLKTAKVISIQIKSSRVYSSSPRVNSSRRQFLHTTFFRVFDVPPEPDWFILVGIYPQDQGHTKSRSATWWSTIMLAFTQSEMSQFMRTVRTRGGKADQFFYFSFDDEKEIFQTRGRQDGSNPSFTEKLLNNRVSELCNALN